MPAPLRNILLFFGCFGVFGGFAHGYLENTDTMVSLQGARAWWLRGDPGLVTAAQAAELPPGTETWAVEHYVAGRIADPVQATFGRTGRGERQYVWFPIGHQALLVPCVALGEWLTEWFPAPAAASEQWRGPLLGAQFWSQFLASFLSPLAAAGSVLVLMRLARVLGLERDREALGLAFVVTGCTQFLPGSNETMSNMPGAFLLYAATLGVARYAAGAGPAALFWGGVMAGIGVLVRYPQALAVALLSLWVLRASWRRGRWRDLGWWVAGGAPGCALLLAANAWRFGDIGETGYSGSAGFGAYPASIGLIAILVAPGKGVLWFTPLLWVVVPSAFTRAARSIATLVAAGVFVITLALYSTVVYWAAGQCWGIRYMTAPIVLLTVVVLAQTRPWRRWPKRFFAVAALGGVISTGGLIAPYPGQQHYAMIAGRAIYGDVPGLDQNVNFDRSLSPVHSHWRYAWLSAAGRLGSTASADTTEPMFGVVAAEPVVVPPVTERDFRHWWWRWLALVWPGFPGWSVAAGWSALTALALWFASKRVSDESPARFG